MIPGKAKWHQFKVATSERATKAEINSGDSMQN